MFSGQRSLGGILVVDDDPAIRKLLVLLLEKSGYDVLVAEDGEDAINLVVQRGEPHGGRYHHCRSFHVQH